MYSLKKLFRFSLTKCANKQRRAMMRSRGLAPVMNKMQVSHPLQMDATFHTAYPMQTFEIAAPTMVHTQKMMTESHGLLDLVNKQSDFGVTPGLGDFASVSQENFAHALHFTKTEIDLGGFNIDDIETVCSQNLGESSIPAENHLQQDASYLEESENNSNVSYTETDIFIEMPNSEVLGHSIPKVENANQSANF